MKTLKVPVRWKRDADGGYMLVSASRPYVTFAFAWKSIVSDGWTWVLNERRGVRNGLTTLSAAKAAAEKALGVEE